MRQEELLEIALEQERTLYRVARTLLRSDADCADAVQDTLLKAAAHAHRLREAASARAWLTRILVNTCKDMLRRERAHPLISTDAHPGILGALPAPEEGRLNEVMGMLDEMDETLRVPMVLFYVEGFTVREIARTLRIPEGTVKSRLWNGRKTLREMMLEEAL